MATELLNRTFYEVTGRRLPNSSYLNLFDVLRDTETNEKFLNIFKSYIVSDTSLDEIVIYDSYEAENNDWWDTIATKFYGNPFLWWVIAMTNDVINPFEYLEPGQEVKVLKQEYLHQILKEIRRIGAK